jgi:hypothetical protein
MKKKYFYILLILLIIILLLGWISIGSKSKILLTIKSIVPNNFKTTLKETIYSYPMLKMELKGIRQELELVKSEVFSGYVFNDENQENFKNFKIINLKSFYIPYSNSFLNEKKKSKIIINENNIIIIFQSGKIVYFKTKDINENLIQFKKINNNLEKEFINNEKPLENGIIDAIKINNDIWTVNLIKEAENCYYINLLKSNLNTDFLLFKNIFYYKQCINNNDVNKNFFKIIDYNNEEILFSVLNDFYLINKNNNQTITYNEVKNNNINLNNINFLKNTNYIENHLIKSYSNIFLKYPENNNLIEKFLFKEINNDINFLSYNKIKQEIKFHKILNDKIILKDILKLNELHLSYDISDFKILDNNILFTTSNIASFVTMRIK